MDEGTVEFAAVDPASADARFCLGEYFSELGRRFERGFDPAITIGVEGFRPPTGLFLVVRRDAEPIGCGAVMLAASGVADLKRMWIAEPARGLGLGRRLLAELERRAAALGAHTVRLETNKALTQAIALYRSSGYVEVPPFNDEPHAHHWFERRL